MQKIVINIKISQNKKNKSDVLCHNVKMFSTLFRSKSKRTRFKIIVQRQFISGPNPTNPSYS